MTAGAPTCVLIHGAWAGAWGWDLVAPGLLAHGLGVVAPDLPGRGPWTTAEVSLDDVVIHVLGAIADLPGPLVIVGHSGGGVVATDVAERLCGEQPRRVAGLAYVAGMMLPPGMSFGGLCDIAGLAAPVGISAFTEPTPDGRGTIVPPEAGAAVFFHGAPAAAAVAAARRLAPQLESTRLIAPTWTTHGAGSLPRLYVEATLDRSVPLAAQREMQRLWPGADVATLETDHAPQLSAPAELVGALTAFARRVA